MHKCVPYNPFWYLKAVIKIPSNQKSFSEIEKGAKSAVLKLQKWHAPKKNKTQLTRQIDAASRNLTQAPLEALGGFYMSAF